MTMRKARCTITGLLVILFLVISGCARMPVFVKTQLRPESLSELEGYVLNNSPTLDLFRHSGPFDVQRHDNRVFALSDTGRVAFDWFVSRHAEHAPLVVFVHGKDNSKESHAYQAMHAASWGLHAVALQLPPDGPWIDNGKTLVRVVDFIHSHAEALRVRLDTKRIILVGHSFGGAAVAVALADKARVNGGILLDPATYGRDLPGYLRRIEAPVLVVGADERVSSAVNRNYFYGFIRGGVTEVSVADAIHEDAQFPAHGAQTTEALQISFASAITAASFSLALTRSFEHAWSSFRDDLANGKLINGRKK